jgi:hypothetical protein
MRRELIESYYEKY